MRRRRRLFTTAAAVSFVLCAASAVVWQRATRGYSTAPYWRVGDENSVSLDRLGIHVTRRNTVWPVVYGPEWPSSTESERAEWRDRIARDRSFRERTADGGFAWSRFGRTGIASTDGGYRLMLFELGSTATLPYWLPTALAATLPAVWLRARLARAWRRRRARPGHCGHCGYDLRATPGRCPECGAESQSEATA